MQIDPIPRRRIGLARVGRHRQRWVERQFVATGDAPRIHRGRRRHPLWIAQIGPTILKIESPWIIPTVADEPRVVFTGRTALRRVRQERGARGAVRKRFAFSITRSREADKASNAVL